MRKIIQCNNVVNNEPIQYPKITVCISVARVSNCLGISSEEPLNRLKFFYLIFMICVKNFNFKLVVSP